MSMKSLLVPALLAIGLGALPSAAPAALDQRSDQEEAYRATREGHVKPLREIESRVLPRMRGFSYLGPEFDRGSAVYRLKFLREGSVVWVDVDARTGAVIGRSGH